MCLCVCVCVFVSVCLYVCMCGACAFKYRYLLSTEESIGSQRAVGTGVCEPPGLVAGILA